MLLSTVIFKALVPVALAKVQYAGVNIAGCDFGCDIYGNCDGSDCPSTVGPAQMHHFAKHDSFNLFRLPVGWQYLVNNNLGGPLDPTFMATYDALVHSCLNTGAHCIVDIHNYARWNGGIIGQGGPTNQQFASLWTQLAKRYAKHSNVIFGIMYDIFFSGLAHFSDVLSEQQAPNLALIECRRNEPHDLDINTWADTLQEVVTAIRHTGAMSQLILLPGTDYTSAGDFATASAPALSSVKDLSGTTHKLIYDVHRYYDSNGSGTDSECVTDHISDSYAPLASYLRQHGRKALLTETGGGNTQSCVKDVCNALTFLNSHSDVYMGWAGWAAGSFAADYTLSEVPTNGKDTLLVRRCIAGKFR